MTDSPIFVAVPARPAKQPSAADQVPEQGNYPKVLECLRQVGLTPRIVSDTSADLSDVVGVVVPGGGDINPDLYGGKMIEQVYGVDPSQDLLDIHLIQAALERGLPLMGICRGTQMINVVKGGSLYEDLPAHSIQHHNNISVDADSSVFVSHEVSITANTKLSRSLEGRQSAFVRSAHHQCVRDLGADLRVVATAEDGIVEAFEGTKEWILAVQWHPEAELADGPIKYGQFQLFADALGNTPTGTEDSHE